MTLDSEPYRLPEPACLIRRVRVRNYKSIRHADVSLSPFTILVGRNGSGKSNFLDALHFAADSLRISLDRATESRGGVEAVGRRTQGAPESLLVELEISLPSGNTADYRFELLPSNRRFVVQQEKLFVRSPQQGNGVVDHYVIHEGTIKSASIQTLPFADNDRLYLLKASGFDPFRETYDALSGMGFYNLNPEAMRVIQSPGPGDILHRDGANVASVIRRLEEERPREMERLESYLSAIVPDLVGVRVFSFGPGETLAFRQKMAGEDPMTFYAGNMSDGTLRVTGILAAAAQRLGQQKRLTLIGIEEPETALHPAAAGALMDALREAATHTQVVVTSHSPDLLDQVDLNSESLLVVAFEEGATRIAPPDKASLEVVRDHLYTPGELLRIDQLEPDSMGKDALPEDRREDEPAEDRADRRRAR